VQELRRALGQLGTNKIVNNGENCNHSLENAFPSMWQEWDRPGGKMDVLAIAANIGYSHG